MFPCGGLVREKLVHLLLEGSPPMIIIAWKDEIKMNTEETAGTDWTMVEGNILLLARELEWAEAYAENFPRCSMGRLYLDFLRWELIRAYGEQ